MRKIVFFIVFFMISFSVMAQNDKETTNVKDETPTIEVAVRKVEPISMNPHVQNRMINYKKSNDLISIKSYMKSLQIKGKLTKLS